MKKGIKKITTFFALLAIIFIISAQKINASSCGTIYHYYHWHYYYSHPKYYYYKGWVFSYYKLANHLYKKAVSLVNETNNKAQQTESKAFKMIPSNTGALSIGELKTYLDAKENRKNEAIQKLNEAQVHINNTQHNWHTMLTVHHQALNRWGNRYRQLMRQVERNMNERVALWNGYFERLRNMWENSSNFNVNPANNDNNRVNIIFEPGFTSNTVQSNHLIDKFNMADYYNCVQVKKGIYGYWQTPDTFIATSPLDTHCVKNNCVCETLL